MTFERSHGKARPTLPRASDLHPGDAGPKPREGRTPGGHFAAGNRLGVGARWKATLKKALGSTASVGETGIVAADAQRVMSHVLRSLPSDAAPVRVMVAIHARHVALNAYFTAKAEAAGLDTEAGLALLAVADRQSQRAERVLVTCHDLARVHAEQDAASRPPEDVLARLERELSEAGNATPITTPRKEG
jgi:hypothetical protein